MPDSVVKGTGLASKRLIGTMWLFASARRVLRTARTHLCPSVSTPYPVPHTPYTVPQSGFVLPLVLVGMAIGTLVIFGMLRYAGTVARVGGQDNDQVLALYATQAGVASVEADLRDGEDALAGEYVLPTSTVNGYDVHLSIDTPTTSTQPPPVHQYVDPGVKFGLESLAGQEPYYFRIDNVQAGGSIRLNWAFTPNNQRWKMKAYKGKGPPAAPTPVTIASDDFESGDFIGGTGWLSDWSTLAGPAVTSTGSPHDGTYHMRLTGTAEAKRDLDTSTSTDARLQFWAKADSFAPGETTVLSLSSNGVDFTTVRVWVDGEDDNVYRYEDIDLSSYSTSTQFWIRFKANMSGVGDLFFVDDLKVVSQDAPDAVAEASDTKGPGELLVDSGSVTAGEYTFEFLNDSGTDLVSGAFGSTGSGSQTWIYVQAHKDYFVTATTTEVTITAFMRQMPGPTSPKPVNKSSSRRGGPSASSPRLLMTTTPTA